MTIRSAVAALVLAAAAVVAPAATPATASAQLSPNLDWRTLKTEHFYIHFTPPLEGLARRVAADAERAYAQLSLQLHPPRGMVDVVLSDDVDFSNGYATPYPTNRIVIYANPPVSESALRYTNDWGQLVITHELTHIFHLDRARGIWAIGQDVFGRAQLLFPNFYDPSWLIEGLAVYEESKLTGAGRIEGSEHRMIARAAASDHVFPGIGALSLGTARYPFGEVAYAYGSLFVDYVAHTAGEDRVRAFVDKSSAELIPYLLNVPAKQAFGITFTQAWKNFSDSIARSTPPYTPPLVNWRQLTRDGVYVYDPRWVNDSTIVYSGAPGRETFGAYDVSLNGKRERVGRRNSQSPNVPLAKPGGGFLYAQLDFTNPYQERSDLWEQHGRHEHRLTVGQRLAAPDVRAPDGRIVAEQIIPGGTRLVLVSRDGKRITPITHGSYDEQWTDPVWSASGDRIAASRWLRGNISQIVVIDTVGTILHVVSSGVLIEATPAWLRGDSGIVYASDRTGETQAYVEQYRDPRTFFGAETYRLSDAVTGLFGAVPSPHQAIGAATLFRADGYHLGVGDCCTASTPGAERVADYRDTVPGANVAALLVDSGRVTRYSPWRTFLPHYWLPTIDQGIDGGYLIGAMTSGYDVVGRHTVTATVEVPTNNTGVYATGSYQYAGLGVPIIEVDASQEWQSLGGIYTRDAARTLVGEVRRRELNGDVLATWVHQRFREAFSLTGGVGLEHRTSLSVPNGLLPLIDTTNAFGTLNFPTLIAAAGYANYQIPPFAISPEDGLKANVTVRDRLASGANGTGPQSLSVVSTLDLFKSLDLPGFAHHVLALRGAAGWADDNANGYFAVGGVSGQSFTIIPGYTVGEGPQTFGVRGFAPGTLIGTRALAGSAEYRIPLLMTESSPGILPFFLDRSSLTLFSDYGSAWCPKVVLGGEVCTDPILAHQVDIASAGAELNFNLGVLSWDSPYRFRLGTVWPIHDGSLGGATGMQWYFTSGVSF